MDIVRSIDTSDGFSDVRTLIAEKYEYVGGENSFRSCTSCSVIQDPSLAYVTDKTRCFEVMEAFYDVQEGKSTSQQYVSCDISFLNFEAIFKMDEWQQHASAVEAAQIAAMRDFVTQQTFNFVY